MRSVKKDMWRWLLIMVLLIGVSIISTGATDKKTKYAVCIVNETDQKVFYKVGWCDREGNKWTGWKNYSIPADYVYSHWSEDLERMDITFHTGGNYGKWDEYSVWGTENGCQDSSTYVFAWNVRGYLRLYDK